MGNWLRVDHISLWLVDAALSDLSPRIERHRGAGVIMQSPKEYLLRALEGACVHGEQPEGFRLDADRAVRIFKAIWLYGNEHSFPLPANDTWGSHFFLLQKNLNVTDISMAELMTLLRQFTLPRANAPVDKNENRDINFFSDTEYTKYLLNIILSLYPSELIINSDDEYRRLIERVSDTITEHHGDLLKDTIILDCYFTSAVVHIPRSMTANVRRVVAESGYIHSAGHALYIRKIEKATEDGLESALVRFTGACGLDLPIYVTPLASETPLPDDYNRSVASTRNGLDGVRLELRKHFISGQPLRDALYALSAKDPNLVVPPGLATYSTERQYALDSLGVNTDTTIWLVCDHPAIRTSENSYVRSRQSYLIAYAQYQENKNQLVLFKERKPAWVAPVTLPHTLSTAMINVARLNCRNGSSGKVILDPFCGTGTTLFDAALRFPSATIIGTDLNPLMPTLLRDNLKFFALSPTEVSDLRDAVSTLAKKCKSLAEGGAPGGLPLINSLIKDAPAFTWATKGNSKSAAEVDFRAALRGCIAELVTASGNQDSFLDLGAKTLINAGFSDALVEAFNEDHADFRKRLFFYVVWRAVATGRYALRDDLGRFYAIVAKELALFERELEQYASDMSCTPIDEVGLNGSAFVQMTGNYSRSSMIDPASVEALGGTVTSLNIDQLGAVAGSPSPGLFVSVGRSSEVLAEFDQSIDLIISDPPYGFNTNEADVFEMQTLYSDLTRLSIRALRPGGQLMLALPAFARNGQQIPFFQTRGALTRQIISATEKAGRRVISVVKTTPAAKDLFVPPYYWQSHSALSRSIVWFTIE